jgi:hypothetical protein
MIEFHVEELHTTLDTVDGDALLTPERLDRIAAAVATRIARACQAERALRADLDTRSIIEQQRAERG